MSRTFLFETPVRAGWIDYNGHMRDSCFALIFSLAVDAMQEEVGFDAAYRQRTGCTIYALESHIYFLREVKDGAVVRVETRIVGCDARRFHLHMCMYEGSEPVAVGEFMELHVAQRPQPRAAPIPAEILAQLDAAQLDHEEAAAITHRARKIEMRRRR